MTDYRESERGGFPLWAFDYHGHRCPFVPLGYRLGEVALREIGIERARDETAYTLMEIGVGHPQTCLSDGVMIATGCTFGKLLIERLGYGKLTMVPHQPGKGVVRVSVLPEFQDEPGREEFVDYRRRGVPASQIPPRSRSARCGGSSTPRRDRSFAWSVRRTSVSLGRRGRSPGRVALVAGSTSSSATYGR